MKCEERKNKAKGLARFLRSRLEPRPWVVIGMVAAFLLALSAVTLSAQVARAEGQPGEGEALVRAWVDALNQKDAEKAIGLYSEDAVILALGKEIRGRDAIAERQRTTITQILDPALNIESIEAQGEEVVLRVRGENAITRYDNHGSVENQVTFTVRDGKIQQEVGPVLSQADMAWYKSAAARFQESRGTPSRLPNSGEADQVPSYQWIAAFGVLGAAMVSIGLVVRRRRPRQLSEVPIDDDR